MRISVDALLLDMDGVLVDSTSLVEQHWTRWAQRRGLDPQDVLRHAHGTPSRDVVARFAPAAEVDDETDWVEALAFEPVVERALPGALAALTQTELPVAVATSATRRVAILRLQRAELRIPDALVGADEVLHGKPDPEPYRRAAALLDVEPRRCVGVEDSPAGLTALRAAGAFAIALTTTHRPDRLHQADAIVNDLAALTIGPGWIELNPLT